MIKFCATTKSKEVSKIDFIRRLRSLLYILYYDSSTVNFLDMYVNFPYNFKNSIVLTRISVLISKCSKDITTSIHTSRAASMGNTRLWSTILYKDKTRREYAKL